MLGKRQRARGEARGKERSKARGNARGNIQEARCNKERRLGVVGNCIDSGLRLFRSYDIPKLKDELVRLHKFGRAGRRAGGQAGGQAGGRAGGLLPMPGTRILVAEWTLSFHYGDELFVNYISFPQNCYIHELSIGML